jgi:hypothetical protein
VEVLQQAFESVDKLAWTALEPIQFTISESIAPPPATLKRTNISALNALNLWRSRADTNSRSPPPQSSA